TPGGGNAEGGHGLTDDVLAEHRPESSTTVAAARELRPPRALQLDIDELARGRPMFAQQNGAAIAEHGEAAELMAGVSLGDRSESARQCLAGEQSRGGVSRK